MKSKIHSLFLRLILILIGDFNMALLYVTLMTKQPKKYLFKDCPAAIKEEVKEMLILAGLEDLITE